MKVKNLILSLSLLTLLSGMTLSLSAQRTTRGRLQPTPAESDASTDDTRAIVVPGVELFNLSGYDKPLRSRRESFFASNHSGAEAVRMALTLTYLDASGRQLHSRSLSVPCSVPDGETRNVSIPSWDSQQSFYFVRSTVPSRVDQATPYDVRIAVDTLFVR